MADHPTTEAPPPSADQRDEDPSPQDKELDSGGGDGVLVDFKSLDNDDGQPRVGRTFKSYGEACYFYKVYAQQAGFSAIVRSSLFKQSGECIKLVLACSRCGKCRGKAGTSIKIGCLASVRLRLRPDGLLHLDKSVIDHNHPLEPMKTARCFTKLSSGKVTRASRECRALLQAGELERLPFVVDECDSSGDRGHISLRPGDSAAINEFFMQMQVGKSNFFYLMDHDAEGRMRTVFWADSRSRAAYQYFGDVVSLDTTCLTNNCIVPLVMFLGVNHHGDPVLLGCGLVSDQTTETYVWLFKAWLASMSGKPPNAVISDQCQAIQEAVTQVFPAARHRLCLWHIMKRLLEKLKVFTEKDEIKKAFKKIVYDSLTANGFEEDWKTMTEKYGLERSEWFNLLYENRYSWAPVFLKDTFWAGMCDTQCCQSMANYFDGFLQSGTSLRQFVSKYKEALQNKYEKEAQADHESIHKTRPSISKFHMEQQLSKLYSYNMFRGFQDELKATMYCDVSLVKVDGQVSIYEVKESVFLEDGKEAENKQFEVIYNAKEEEVQCICGSFPFRGILCRHALSVLKLHQVYEIPSRYIISRWRKDYKWLHNVACSSSDAQDNNSSADRYDYLSMRCFRLVDMGILSDEKYQLALKLIGEVEKNLLDDSIIGNSQKKQMPSKCQTNENTEEYLLPQSAFSKGDKVLDSFQVKRRGRPPKKRKELDAESDNRSNNDSPNILLANPNNGAQVAASSTNLSIHMGTQRAINLMEDVNLNNLSFGGHFGQHAGHQHPFGNQPAAVQFDTTMQGRVGQQTIGNHSIPWFYQQISQDDQLPEAPPGSRNGY